MEQQANMMPGGMPGQGNPQMNNSMQRPQPGNMQQQLHARIMEELRRTQPSIGTGWQTMLDLRERASRIMQLITQLRNINQDVGKCYNIAVTWELKVITSTASKEQYVEQMAAKLREITAKRQQAAAQMNMNGNMGMMPNNMMNMQNGMMNAPNMQNNGMGSMNLPNGGNMGMQGGRMQPGQNPMAQLQRQMQASPLPMQQSQQQSGTLDPSALQMPQQGNQQQQAQQPPSQQGQNMGQSNQPQQPGMNQSGPGKSNQAFQNEIMSIAKQMSDRMTAEQRSELRQQVLTKFTDQQKAQMQQQNIDPLMKFFMGRAQSELAKRHQRMAMQNQPGMGNGNNMNMSMGNNVPQRPPSQTSGQKFDFSSLMGQQANALKLQDAGEQVVPASNNSNNTNNKNSSNMGNSMNMPQNVNPQMLGNNNNQGQQGGNGPMNPQQMQLMMMQQRAHQERLNKQMMAQQHAMASRQQHSQLQGQPGGLHTPNGFGGGTNGQVNSPAMSMLNRPMAPPGQTTPGTPQPNRQQPMPSTPMNNGVIQLQQHHQNMLNQNNQQQVNQTTQNNNLSFQDILAKVPPNFREKLSQMPQEQARMMLQKFQNLNGARPQGLQGMPNGMPNGMNMGPSQQGNQPGMPQQNMGNAIPGFNSQPPPNQMNMDPASQLQQRMQREQNMRLKAQAMDMRPFPKPILTQLGIAVPPNVQLWGHLKQHVMQNSPQGTIDKVNQAQGVWFQNNQEEFQAAMTAMMQRIRMGAGNQPGQQGPPGQGQQQAQQNGAAQPPASMPDRPAPPAQMVPPAPMMQPQGQGAQPGANQGTRPMPTMPTISPQELAMFRSRVPQAGGMSDDQIRHVLVRQKFDKMRQHQQMQRQSLQNAQMQKPPGQAGAQPNSTSMGQPQQQRTPQPPAGQQSAMPQPKPQPQTNNEVVEISSQPVSQNVPQAAPMQAGQTQNPTQPPLKQLSREQIQQLSEPDRKAYLAQAQQMMTQKENLRKAQGQMGAANRQGPPGGQNPNQQRMPISPANMEKIKSLQQEVTRTFTRGNPVQCDAPTMEKAKMMLRRLYQPLNQLSTTFGPALALGFDDNIIKRLMKAILNVNANIDQTGNIKDYLSATIEDLHETEKLVGGYMQELKRKKQQNDNARQEAANVQAQGVKNQQAAPPAGMAWTASQQNHVRKASTNNNTAPPAPTDNKPFDWAAPSPHGVPKYEMGRNELTPDKLKFPPQKKRKTDQAGSQASTPAAQPGAPAAGAAASPALTNGKVQSPDQTRKTPAQIKAEAEKAAEQKKFLCSDNTCEAALRGFETEEQLKQHQESQHQPIEDPLQFLLGNLATACEVDQDGKPLSKAPAAAPKGRVKPEPKGKEDQKKLQGSETASASQKSLTLSGAMSQKLDLPVAPEEPPEVVTNDEDDVFGLLNWPPEVDEHGLIFMTPQLMGQMLSEGWVEDPDHMGLFNLRPGALDQDSSPDLTPSEGSQTSQNSDVSQNDSMKFTVWFENLDTDMLGDGNQGVPEGILPLFEQMENINMMKDGEDTQMDNNDDSKGEGDASKKRKAPEMWQPPVADFMKSFYDEANPNFS